MDTSFEFDEDEQLGPWMRREPANEKGRDFVIGDLHGCLDELMALLARVRFSVERDRLFSVGDLVDRGPRSMDCLRLLRRPWFYACRGNHEQMLIDHLRDPNGTQPYDPLWIMPDIEEELFDLLPSLEALPHLIRVGDAEQRYYVLHAEIWRPGAPLREADLDHFERENGHTAETVRATSIWGRKIIEAHWRGNSPQFHHDSLPLMFCGHSIVESPLRCQRAVCMDTGAFTSYLPEDRRPNLLTAGLSMIEPATMQHWLASSAPSHRGVVLNLGTLSM